MARGRSNQSRGRHKPPSQPARPASAVDDAAAALSDSSLDEELLDYLENVNKQQQDSSDTDGTPSQQPHAGGSEGVPAPHAAANPGHNLDGAQAEDDDPDNWRPAGLGYQPIHGFSSATAAAQFADTSLDHALEGDLAYDMQQDDTSSNSSTSSSLSGDSSSADSDTGSDSDSEADNDTAGHAGLGFDTSLPVVVDASGKPRQHWHELSLQERYPVQARHEQTPRSPAVDGSSGGSKSSRQRQQRGPRPRDVLIDNISTSMLLANRTGSMPEFQSDDITAAVAAATTAAADVAKQQVAQYAELAQQLQQAQQNPNKRPGSRGRGVKKQLKKAKVAAKRNAREARTEAGALQLLSAFEVFAGSGQDMQVLPPCGSRQKEGFAKQLARLFGVSASSQGGGSSGRTCMVLTATADTQAQLEAPALQQLQVLLRGELAKELASSTIARDDTMAVLKKKEKQRKRSSNQQAGMQRQGSRGTPGRVPPPDYQAPVLFVAAGTLDPNSSLLDYDKYTPPKAAAAATYSRSGGSSSSSESDAGEGVADRGVKGRGRVGPDHAEVGAFLQALLLEEEEALLLGGEGQDCAAAASTAKLVAAEETAAEAATGTQAAAATEGPAAESAVAEPAGSAAADRQQQSEAPLRQTAEPAWFIDRTGGSAGDDSLPVSTGLGFVPAAVVAAAADTATHHQSQQPAAAAAAAAAFVPTWFECRSPTRTVYSLGGCSKAFIAAGTADDDLPRPSRPSAAAAAETHADAQGVAVRDGEGDGPMYSRAGVGLGFGGTAGLGSAAAAEADAGFGHQQQQQDSDDDGGGTWILSGPGSSSRRKVRSKGAAGSGAGGGGSSSSARKLAQLQAEFQSLQVPGGRAALAAAAAQSKAEQKQQRREQQQQRANKGSKTLEELIAAVEASAAQPTFNATAQQTNKARKKQQRNQRREANRSAAAEGFPAAAVGAPAVPQQQQQQDVGFATFEVHTTGIGSRLLSAWGWNEGEGLGRARQGRAEPLRAERRPKQLGLGFE